MKHLKVIGYIKRKFLPVQSIFIVVRRTNGSYLKINYFLNWFVAFNDIQRKQIRHDSISPEYFFTVSRQSLHKHMKQIYNVCLRSSYTGNVRSKLGGWVHLRLAASAGPRVVVEIAVNLGHRSKIGMNDSCPSAICCKKNEKNICTWNPSFRAQCNTRTAVI